MCSGILHCQIATSVKCARTAWQVSEVLAVLSWLLLGSVQSKQLQIDVPLSLTASDSFFSIQI